MDILDLILAAAKRHGEDGDPDMEVGDLQQLARDLWAMLTPKQRKAFPSSCRVIDWSEFINAWSPEEHGQG
jgi:hypothetical protein